jgi:hypothetical protein
MKRQSKGQGMSAGMFWASFSNCGHLGELKPTAPRPQHLTDSQKATEKKLNQAVAK